MTTDPYRFDGKRAIVVGGASGIGGATTEVLAYLGADVVILDLAKPAAGVSAIELDLTSRASIDAAVDKCGAPIDALVLCAGVADGTPGLPTINFVGQRHLIERAFDEGFLPSGSTIAMVSSAAGRGWQEHLPELLEYVTTPSFEAGEAWIATHPDRASYMWSKEAVCAYVARRAFRFAAKGVRINSTMPGPTDTPLARANAEPWLTYASDYRDAIGLGPSTPEEQAWILAFLCSRASHRIIGASVISDAGNAISRLTGGFPPS